MKIREEILALETIEIDTTFSEKENKNTVGWAKKFFVVPTEMVINGNRDLWDGCPNLVNYDLLQCIEEIVAKGHYPYNSTVGQLFCDKNSLGTYTEHTFLSAMVYCTQNYREAIKDEENAKEFDTKMREQGFYPATSELLNEAVNTKRKFLIVSNTTNIFGSEGKAVKEDKLLLKDWGEAGLHWMNPRAKRKGYRATIGQYIKEAV